ADTRTTGGVRGEVTAVRGGAGMNDLQRANADAKLALRREASDRDLRQRAEALRAVVQRIECTFTATGQTVAGSRPDSKNSCAQPAPSGFSWASSHASATNASNDPWRRPPASVP